MINKMHESATEVMAKMAPPVTVSGMTLFGIPIPEVVQILTAIYVFFMAVDKVFVLYLRYKNRKTDDLKS